MRFSILTLAFALMATICQAQLKTYKLDLKTTGGGVADDTVTITRSADDEMVFKDADTGTTYPLAELASSGVTDHGALTGLADDDHSTYTEWRRFADRLGIEAGVDPTANIVYSTTGSALTRYMPIVADGAGNATLGAHTTDTQLHVFRWSRIVTVGADNSGDTVARGADYTTIDAAVNAISDSASNKQYVILVLPGDYTEVVTLDKGYISIIGVDRDSCIIDNEAIGVLNITTNNAGLIANLTLRGEVGTAIVQDGGTGDMHFENVHFYGEGTGRATAYSKTAAGNVFLTNCRWSEDGSAGVASYSIQLEAAGAGKMYIKNARLDTTKDDHVFFYAPAGHAGGGSVYVDGFFVDDTIGQSAAHGLFRLNGSVIVELYSADFASYGIVIHPSSTAGFINHSNVQTEEWGTPTSGLTTAPIQLSGPEFMSTVNIANNSDLQFGGNTVIDKNRDGTFQNLTATTVSWTAISGPSIFTDFNTVDLTFTTGTEAQETSDNFSKIRTTSDVLKIEVDKNANYSSDLVRIVPRVQIDGLGTGGLTDYDLMVGDTTTPDYGSIQIGNACLGRTSYNVGNVDLDGTFIFRNLGGPVTGPIEFLWEEGSGATRFALATSGIGKATYNSRGLICAGPAPADSDMVLVSYWQGQGIFHNLSFDTDGQGADGGFQNDVEIERYLFINSISESTSGAGINTSGTLVIDGLIVGTEELSGASSLTAIRGAVFYNQTANANVELPDPATSPGLVVSVYASHASGFRLNAYLDAPTIQGDVAFFDLATSDMLTLVSDGTNWHTMSHHVEPVALSAELHLGVHDLAALAGGGAGATFTDVGAGSAWVFPDGQEKSVSFSISLPKDLDRTKDIDIELHWYSPANGLDCDWEVQYRLVAVAEDVTQAAQETLQAFVDCDAANVMVHTQDTFTIDAATQIAALDEQIVCTIMRDGNDGGDTLSATAGLIGVNIRYTKTAASN